MRRLAVLVATVLALGACGVTRGASSAVPVPSTFPPTVIPTPATAPAPGASSTATPGSVFVIVMENKDYATAMAQRYTASLAARFGLATNYFGVAHPSLPNYLALTSGATWGVTDDGYHKLPDTGIGRQLTDAGVSWRAYMEDMSAGCLGSPMPYAVKHNPFAYYGGTCPVEVVPMTRLGDDLAGDTPRFVWITPNLCHDGHDCPASEADRFLSTLVPEILASAAWQRGGVLFVTWDEDDGGNGNRVPCLVVAPHLAAQRSGARHDHFSLLATIEDRLGVERLGSAQRASTLTDILG